PDGGSGARANGRPVEDPTAGWHPDTDAETTGVVTRPPTEPTFLIGYASLPTARITEGVALLAAAVRESTAR
ncbi:hypothetical protein ABZ356_30455, partial [Micromonospora zamorensis]|uniref:hypothetical protein n=1 Tax=Micromonospora zamorensis TaxID=709883 RepID=UPI0033CA090B